MGEIVNVTVTAPDADWLRSFTRRLVDEGLAAAGNLNERVTSIYRWNDDVHEAIEAVVSLRTQRRHVSSIVAAVNEHHPYEVPHVVATPIIEANERYQAWIIEATGGASG